MAKMLKTVTTAGKEYKKGTECPEQYEKDWSEAGYAGEEHKKSKKDKEG